MAEDMVKEIKEMLESYGIDVDLLLAIAGLSALELMELKVMETEEKVKRLKKLAEELGLV